MEAEEAAGPLPFGIVVPFVDTLGCELWRFGEGRAELRLSIDETLQNSWGTAHGGVLMTLLDVAMAQAARSADRHRDPATPPRGMATIEMKTSFLRPAEGRLRAEGALLHRTATLAFTEGRVLDESGAVCAHATGTFKYLTGLPVSRDDSRQRKPRHAEPRARHTKE
jgi:uncharacterized protein (TIGR00369 family)